MNLFTCDLDLIPCNIPLLACVEELYYLETIDQLQNIELDMTLLETIIAMNAFTVGFLNIVRESSVLDRSNCLRNIIDFCDQD